MIKIAVDIGMKNFCIVVANDSNIEMAEIYNLTKSSYIEDVIKILEDIIKKIPEIDIILIEKQLSKNIKCHKIETAIETYCIINRINYKKVHPKKKYKVYNIDLKSYFHRKKWVIEKGAYIFEKYYNNYPLESFKKKDDLCDCIIMIHLHNLNL